MKLGVLIDSGCYYDEDLLKGTDIHTIPLRIITQDGRDFLDTKVNRESNDIFTLNATNARISTSMASAGEVMEKYEEMLKTYDHIIHMTIAPNLSGMHQTALMVAKDFEGKVTIINQYITANPVIYMAKKFIEMNKKGVNEIAEFQKFADSVNDKVFIGLIPGDIAKLNKGGRTKSLLVAVLKILKQRVIIKWGEEPEKLALSRTFTGLFDKALAEIKKINKNNDNKVLLVYSPAIAEKTLETTKKFLEENKVNYELQLMPAIYSMHAGNDTVALISIPNELI